MNDRVGVAELRQNLSVYLRRVGAGERLIVTDRNLPIAQLTPLPSSQSRLDQLIAEGRVKPPKRRGQWPEPMKLGGDPYAGSRALAAMRGDD